MYNRNERKRYRACHTVLHHFLFIYLRILLLHKYVSEIISVHARLRRRR